jgi:hypothetical protein
MNPMSDMLSGTHVGTPGSPKAPVVGLDDPRVIQAVEQYLAALESGPVPDRKEFLARHPEIAEALARCLEKTPRGSAPPPRARVPTGRALRRFPHCPRGRTRRNGSGL